MPKPPPGGRPALKPLSFRLFPAFCGHFRLAQTPCCPSIAEDSIKPSHTIATLKTPVKQGEWHHLRFEWEGDRMAASLNGQELRAQHPYLATAKSRSWLAVGKAAKVRHLQISGEKTAAK